MTIDDALAQLFALPRIHRPKFGDHERRLLKIWLFCRRDPQFRKEIYGRYRLEDRERPISPRDSMDDLLLVQEAYSFFEWTWTDRMSKDPL